MLSKINKNKKKWEDARSKDGNYKRKSYNEGSKPNNGNNKVHN